LCIGVLAQCLAIGQTPDGPRLHAGDIVNAADYSSGGVAPGEIVVIYPENVGPPRMVPWGLEGDARTTRALAETSVLFDGTPAIIVYAVRGQVCAIVPHEVAGKRTTNVVVEYQGLRSPPVTLAVIHSAPALFTLDASGKGQAAMLNDTGCCNSVRNPAVRGKPASLYATGEGRIPAGVIARNISVTVGGIPAKVLYTGNKGSLQVNFRVPPNAPVGDAIPLVLRVGNRQSSLGVTMAVRSERQSVLLLNDDTVTRHRLARILTVAGYQVVTDQASEQPDLVIVDLAKLRRETSEIISSLRQLRPQVRVMAMSRQFDADALRTADLLGAQVVLTEPLNAVNVQSRVRRLLEVRPARY
jgi:uncharacterized protein (TIGR03437 family)